MRLVGLIKSFKTFNLNKQLVQITISNLNNNERKQLSCKSGYNVNNDYVLNINNIIML